MFYSKFKVESPECMEWAYGAGWQAVSLKDIYLLWNERHSDVFEIVASDSIEECCKRIKKAYETLKKGK